MEPTRGFDEDSDNVTADVSSATYIGCVVWSHTILTTLADVDHGGTTVLVVRFVVKDRIG
ncbi:hypothetical protein D3C73_1572930 [compost metagenome]